jgi:hypothetical protein
MTISLRHQCRYCRSKLSEPTDNMRRAFCCRGCFQSYFRSRCVVCEGAIRRKRESQKTCIGVRCKRELSRFKLVYSWPERLGLGHPSGGAFEASKTLDSIGSESPISALPRSPMSWRDLAGNGWCWEADLDGLEHRLFNREGKLAARIEASVGTRWRLAYPTTIPIQSAPDLEAGKPLATSTALANLPNPRAIRQHVQGR